jgi:mannose-6-phosphate isomerase-like protein (cupin superfamily)
MAEKNQLGELSDEDRIPKYRNSVSVTQFLFAALFVFVMPLQDTPRPTCNRCQATYVPNSELQAYLNRVPRDMMVSDQQVRAVDVGKSNVDVAVVYRGKLTGNSNVAEHDQVSEVYHILDGAGTLVTGPEIVDFKRRPADTPSVKLLNGPGGDGSSIRNGVSHELKPGDVIVIPAGTGHWFTKIDDHIRYLMIRIDPDKVTPLKDAAASRADLAGTK